MLQIMHFHLRVLERLRQRIVFKAKPAGIGKDACNGKRKDLQDYWKQKERLENHQSALACCRHDLSNLGRDWDGFADSADYAFSLGCCSLLLQ